jgi:apolipoprotein N-acyltransferase
VFDRTGVSAQQVISHNIAIRTGKTVYVALGDKPWAALVALVFLVGILNRAKIRSKSQA